jgi:hypothetical protein
VKEVPEPEAVDLALYDGYRLPLFDRVLRSMWSGHQHSGDIVQEPTTRAWQQAAELIERFSLDHRQVIVRLSMAFEARSFCVPIGIVTSRDRYALHALSSVAGARGATGS